jgi:ubiquinone/menaquinone biosynthesis C-methylase UbiE
VLAVRGSVPRAMGPGEAAEYVHGYATEEQQRLFAQAEHWRAELILAGTRFEPGTRLLEIGCGVGAVLGVLGSAFPGLLLTGVDIEPRQLEVAGRHLEQLGLRADLREADALALPFSDASFDHVWMMWFLEHVDDPVAALKEARRVLVPGGRLTAIEVDYKTVWASPRNAAFEALVDAMARTMDAHGRSDIGTQLPRLVAEAQFESIDPGELRQRYVGAELARQAAYVQSVLAATVPELRALPDARPSQLEAGLAHLRALPHDPDAALGWVMHKTRAVR